jgi:TolB-like protein
MALLCILLLSSALNARAQGSLVRRVAVFDFVPLAGAPSSYARLIADSLSLELERVGYPAVPGARLRELLAEPATEVSAALAAARFAGADVAVIGFYALEGGQLRIGVRAIDASSEALALSAQDTGLAGLDIFDTIDRMSADIAGRIKIALEPVPTAVQLIEREEIIIETIVVEEVIELGTPIRIRLLSADEGALLQALDGERGLVDLGVIQEGYFDLATKEGAFLSLRLSKEGFNDRSLEFTATGLEPELRLKALARRPAPEWFARLSLDRPFGAEAGTRRFFWRDLVSLDASAGLYFIPYVYPEFLRFGIEPSIDAPGGSADLLLATDGRFYPLNFFLPGSLIQPYLSLGFSADLTLAFSPSGEDARLSFLFKNLSGIGLRWTNARFSLSAEARLVSPAILSLGALQGSRGPEGLRLSLELAVPW